MENKINVYNLNNNENRFYIFEVKLKDIEGCKYKLKKIKYEKEGNLVNILDNITDIILLKIIIFDINDPSNLITIKKEINNENNLIIKYKKLLLHINNNDLFILNYKFLN
jgi:hypothetical protein